MLAAIVLAVLAIYASVLGYGFLDWDDRVHTVDNRHIADTAYYWRHFEQGMYMPVTFSAWSILYRWFGDNPAPFHGLNLLLHAANAVLVFLVLEQLLESVPRPSRSGADDGTQARRRTAPSCLSAGGGALLFAVHPLQAEPVSWITSLKDLGYGFFSLLAIFTFVRFVRTKRAPWHWLHLASIGALVVATLCKPAAIAVVLILAALCLLWWAIDWRRSLSLLWPFAAAALPAAVLNGMSQQRLTLLYHTPLHLRPLVALDSLGFYLGKVLLPWELSPAYERSPRWLIESGTITYGWLAGAVAVGLVLLMRKRYPELLASFAVFFAAVVLVLGLKSFAAQDNTTVYDRYVYLAMLGPALLAGTLLYRARQRWQLVIAGLALLALGAKSAVQTRHWESDRTLWTYALEQRPDSAVALVALGLQHSKDGHRERAIELYERAVKVKPHDVEAHHNLGAVLASMGKLAEAEGHFIAALELNPKNLSARNHLSRVYFETGKLDLAERHTRLALDRAPHHPDVAIRLGEVLLAQGRLPECIAHMESVVRWLPDHPDGLTLLGVALAQNGQEERAIGYFRAALHIHPQHESARHNLDVALGRSSSAR